MRPNIIFCNLLFCIPFMACGDACEEPKPIPKEPDIPIECFFCNDVPDDLPPTPEAFCNNDIDDDEDGLPDCADDDCANSPHCQNIPNPPQVSSIAHGATFTLVDLIDAMTMGTPPIQREVDPSTLHPNDIGLIRGQVLNRQGQPVAGARVEILEQPERGYTHTRSDGVFDLLVPGADRYMVRITKDNHPPIYRKAYVQYGQVAWINDVRLTPLSADTTKINMDDGGVAVGPTSEDKHGSRRPVVYLPQNTTAEFELWDGRRQAAPKDLTFRLTEYTTNDDGPDAMPGPLPPTSAYTYAVELNADEAITANARHIHFNQPVPYYVDNFLGFPVGTSVPLGIYDPVDGWVPSRDGIVIKVLSKNAKGISIDFDGDDMPDDPMRLYGATTQEWVELVQHLEPGKSYWRVASTKLSPHDLNVFFRNTPLNYRPRPEFQLPFNRKARRRPFWGKDCLKNGSIIDCQKQAVRDHIELPGTPYFATIKGVSQNAVSQAAPTTIAFDPWNEYRRLELNTPEALRYFYGIKVTVLFAGHRHEAYYGVDKLAQKPMFRYDLPELDAWGRSLEGQLIPGEVILSYIYGADYTFEEGTTETIRRSFANYMAETDSEFLRANGRVLNVESTRKNFVIDLANAKPLPQINVHHRFDHGTNTILYGDGTSDQLDPAQLATVRAENPCVNCYDPPLNDPEEAQPLNWFSPPETFLTPGGQRMALYGAISLYADGDPAQASSYIQKRFDVVVQFDDEGKQTIVWKQPYDSNITYSQPKMHRTANALYVVKRQSDTRTTTIEKLNINSGLSTTLFEVNKDNQGSPMTDIYHWDIHPNGRMIYLLGRVRSANNGNYDVLRQVDLENNTTQDIYETSQTNRFDVGRIAIRIERQFVINSNGEVILAATDYDSGSTVLVKLIGINQFDPIAGHLATLDPTSNTLNSAALKIPRVLKMTITRADLIHLYVSPNGNQSPYILQLDDEYGFVAMGNPSGGQTICSEPTSTGIFPTACKLTGLEHFFGGTRDGSIYMLGGNSIIRRKNRWKFDTQLGGIRVPALDYRQWYVFAPDGRLLRTEDGHTGAIIRNFEYNIQKQLVAIAEVAPKWQTTLAWTEDRLVIEGPSNRSTTFTFTPQGQLDTVINPDMTTIQWTFTREGLIKSRIDPDGGQKTYDYEQNRLVQSTLKDNAGTQQLAQMTEADGSLVTTFTDARGLQTTYRQRTNEGGTSILTTTHPNASTTEVRWTTASFTKTSPSGMQMRRQLQDLPLDQTATEATKGMIKRYTTSTPSNKQIEVMQEETLRFKPASDEISTWEKQHRQTGGGLTAKWTQRYDATQRVMRWTTPNGQSFTEKYNENNQLIERTNDGMTTTLSAQYDQDGQLSQLTRGDQRWQYTWDGMFLTSKTNALGHKYQFSYTPNGELQTRTLPAQQVYTYGRDSMGRVNELIMPKGGKHLWTYNQNGSPTRYTPPGKMATQWSYQTGHVLKDITKPDGRVLALNYNQTTGQITSKQAPDFTIDYTYHPSGQFDRVTRQQMDGQRIGEHYEYDGDLITNKTTTFNTQTNYDATWTYDGLWRATAVEVQGTSLTMARDRAGMLTQIGGWQITRNGPSKSVSSMTRGALTQQLNYDPEGYLVQRHLQRGATALYGYTITRDAAGRAIQIDERIGTQSQSTQYTYDDNGRLLTVKRNNIIEEHYNWDDNGNITDFNGAQVTYDDADEVTSWSNKTVEHNANGHIKTLGDWRLSYDTQGHLIGARHTDGRRIQLLYDGIGRLVSRTKDNQSHRFLYNNLASPFQVTQIVSPTGQMTHLIYDEFNHLIEIKGATTLLVGTDNIGSPRVWTTTSGTVQNRIEYTAFGQIRQETTPQWTWIGFAGALQDPDLPLLRFGLRHYAPELGRWITRDPTGIKGSPNNLYNYVEGNPITYRDPNGLFCIGGSFYTGIGLGGTICYNWTDGQAGGCFEWGAGLGAGVDIQPFADPPDNSSEAGFNIKIGMGPVALDGGTKIDECGDASANVNLNLGPLQVPIFEATNAKVGLPIKKSNKLDKFVAETKEAEKIHTIKAEIKATVKKCRRW